MVYSILRTLKSLVDELTSQIAKASGHLETTSPADEGVELLKPIDAHEHYLRREGAPASVHPTTVYKSDVSLKHVSDVRTTEANIISGTSQDGTARHEGTRAKVQPKLCQLKSDDVDAICADGEGAINSLRDVQVGLHDARYGTIRMTMNSERYSILVC